MSSIRPLPSVDLASVDDRTAYRAISRTSVLSLVLGILSVLSFAPSLIFFLAPLGAVIAGVHALWQIAAAPQEWAGKRFAQVGIVLAVVCTVGTLSLRIGTTLHMKHYGRAAADRFVEKLKAGDLESAFWLTIPQQFRASMVNTPMEQLPQEMIERFGQFSANAGELAQSLAAGTSTVEFETFEGTGQYHSDDYALVVYRIHTHAGESHLLVTAASAHRPDMPGVSWYIRDNQPNYVPHSFQIQPPSHEHGHMH